MVRNVTSRTRNGRNGSMTRWANAVPDRAEQQELKRKAIIREAARIFSRRGCHGATLDDVADRLGVSKAALYRYVRNKNDLLFACHEEAMEIADRTLTEGERSGRTGLEKIRIGMSAYLAEMIGELGVPVLILEENALQGEEAERIYALRDAYERRLRALVEQGIADGSILPMNPKLAVFMLLGAIHWVTKWYNPDGAWRAGEVAEALMELVTRALAAQPPAALGSAIHRGAAPAGTEP
ncbi:MAG: TetR/AcrR family transcriptional regulator [Alphaproteobacteria bacterium]|nr:MAG: TetR/AcrR family transcriptional regulator [Alphaproteobacteria bacterium]